MEIPTSDFCLRLCDFSKTPVGRETPPQFFPSGSLSRPRPLKTKDAAVMGKRGRGLWLGIIGHLRRLRPPEDLIRR